MQPGQKPTARPPEPRRVACRGSANETRRATCALGQRLAVLVASLLSVTCAGQSLRGSVEAPTHDAPVAIADRWPPALRVGRGTLRLDFSGFRERALEERLVQWVQRSAQRVSEYLGGFPVPELDIQIEVRTGSTVGFGKHSDGRSVQVWVGRSIDDASLARDGVMLHEMLHAAFPALDGQHRWMGEGLSTYLESVLRVRAGIIAPEQMWQHWLRRMPYGLTKPGDGGLDATPTWGRRYWGGALFWLLVDVHLRRRHGSVQGLAGIMQSLRTKEINARQHWSAQQLVEFADQATQSSVVSALYREHGLSPGKVSLPKLWRRLGVRRDARGQITLDDSAVWAQVRRAIATAHADP